MMNLGVFTSRVLLAADQAIRVEVAGTCCKIEISETLIHLVTSAHISTLFVCIAFFGVKIPAAGISTPSLQALSS